MTFEEIKDMINSTITENGQRHITGKAINLALIETVTHLSATEEDIRQKQESFETITVPTIEERILKKIEEALAEGGGGAASEIVYLPDMNTGEMDPEDQAHNLEVYNKFKDAFEKGEPLPLLSMDLAFMFAQIEQQLGMPANVSGYMQCIMVVFIPVDSPMAAQSGDGIMFMTMDPTSGSGNLISGLIQSDGNVMSMM